MILCSFCYLKIRYISVSAEEQTFSYFIHALAFRFYLVGEFRVQGMDTTD